MGEGGGRRERRGGRKGREGLREEAWYGLCLLYNGASASGTEKCIWY